MAAIAVVGERKGDPNSHGTKPVSRIRGHAKPDKPDVQRDAWQLWPQPRAPAVDATEKDGNLIIRAELPGVKPEDVDISLHGNVLSISGERKAEEEVERGGYYIRERSYGTFSRTFTLPQGTDESKIRARYEHGVLEVTVEGAAVVEEPRRIQIEGPGS